MKTQYPKPYMSITELVSFAGLSRDYLKQLTRVEDAPLIRTLRGGKIYYMTAELDDFMIEVMKRVEKSKRIKNTHYRR